jgi:hypothetical protein
MIISHKVGELVAEVAAAARAAEKGAKHVAHGAAAAAEHAAHGVAARLDDAPGDRPEHPTGEQGGGSSA